MGIENGGIDPENLEDKQSTEPAQSGPERQLSRRSVIRAGIGAAALFMGRTLVKHDKAAAQEATSPMIVPGTGPKENSNRDQSASADEIAGATSPAIVEGSGDMMASNPDTQAGDSENAVATSSAIQPLATNVEQSTNVILPEQNGEADSLNDQLQGPLDINRQYIDSVFPPTDSQSSVESAPQAALHIVLDPNGDVVLDYSLEHATDSQGIDHQLKVDYFVIYPTDTDYHEQKGIVVPATGNTMNLSGDQAAVSLLNGGQVGDVRIQAVGTLDGKENVLLAQAGGGNAGIIEANDRPVITGSQTTSAATLEATPNDAADNQNNQESHGSGLLTKKDLVKGAVGLGAGAVIGAAIKGKKRDGG